MPIFLSASHFLEFSRIPDCYILKMHCLQSHAVHPEVPVLLMLFDKMPENQSSEVPMEILPFQDLNIYKRHDF